MKSSISGFTIVRNATILNYPLEASLRSLFGICDEVIVNCGDSDDDTLERCRRLEAEFPGRLHLFQSKWEREGQRGGFQLKCQTDAALSRCRGEWCFYLQADEVIHEGDLPAIREALSRAGARQDVDGLVFDYLHFYGDYRHFMVGRNWYRREVRLFKRGRDIEAFRDAQGFRVEGRRLRALPSGARVFHYGYVRSAKSFTTKSSEMAQWWGERPEALEESQLRRHLGLKTFHGTHPLVMTERTASNGDCWDPTQGTLRWDKHEIKNALTLIWESLIPYRIGEFRNYDLA